MREQVVDNSDTHIAVGQIGIEHRKEHKIRKISN